MIMNLLRCTVCLENCLVSVLHGVTERSLKLPYALLLHVRPLLEYGSCVRNVKYLLMRCLEARVVLQMLDKGDSWYVRDGICG